MSKYVCDASVLLAYYKHETGWEKAEEYINDSVLSSVNYSEFIAKLEEFNYPVENLSDEYDVIDFDREQAFLAGKLRSKTRALGLSLGDRACLALGLKLGKPVVTADKAWQKLKIGVKVICVR